MCSAKPHDGVANSLEDGYKEQNRSHAKHESGLIVTDVLWSLGLLVTTVSPAKADETSETWGLYYMGFILAPPGEHDWMMVCGGDALCQITFTTCYILRAYLMRKPTIAYFFLAYNAL